MTMKTTELAAVRHQFHLGAPLPFNVHDADGTLLLAQGQRIDDESQLGQLFDRGAVVALAELQTEADRVRLAPRELLPRLWSEGLNRVGHALLNAPHHSFKAALDDATDPVLSLVARDPDLAIFQILRTDANPNVEYGVLRSTNTAITAYLVAQRLAWTPSECNKVFKVALTSNISMLELQGQLSRRRAPPTPQQRAELQSHPLRSAVMLQRAGVTDNDWLQAVARHHEMEDGSGYPSGRSDVGDLASLVRRADVYTSKLCARSHRDAMSADLAGRQMFMQDPGHPMTAALVKEFGVYPPGCHVRLANGSTAIVVQRGPTVTTPIVACLSAGNGAPLVKPLRVETSHPDLAVVAVIGQRAMNHAATAEKLMSLSLR
jgi:hypothetical protein